MIQKETESMTLWSFQCLCLLILCALCAQADVGNSAVLKRIRSIGRPGLRSNRFCLECSHDIKIQTHGDGKSLVAQSRVSLGYATLVDEVRLHTQTKGSKCPKKKHKRKEIYTQLSILIETGG